MPAPMLVNFLLNTSFRLVSASPVIADSIVHLAELVGVTRQSLNGDCREPARRVLCKLATQRFEKAAADQDCYALSSDTQENTCLLCGNRCGQPYEVQEFLVLLVHGQNLLHMSVPSFVPDFPCFYRYLYTTLSRWQTTTADAST